MKRRLFHTSIVAALAAGALLGLVGPAGAYSNNFESDVAGWNNSGGTINKQPSGYDNDAYADGIASSTGDFHARLDRGSCVTQGGGSGPAVNCGGPFTRWDGYSHIWHGPYQTQVDIYLDAAYANANPDTYGGNIAGLSSTAPASGNPADPANEGTRFDYTSAINKSTLDGADTQHLRDFGFNVSTGYADDSCSGFMVTGQTNVNRINANPNISGHSPQCIANTGWYTFKHSFSDENGFLKVVMEIIPVGSTTPSASWTITGIDPSGTFGCNRYGWFSNQEIFGLPIDNAKLTGGCDQTPAPTTGTWTQYGSHSTNYQAAVQQPINTANTSNWNSKSKGAIPVMFKLSSATGPTLFQSIGSDTSTTNDYAYASFSPDELTFSEIDTLEVDYHFTLGNCHGGSLRWEIGTDGGNVFVYYGDGPNFTDCNTNNQSGVNMVGLSDLRWDTSQVGGTFYDTHANAVALIGNEEVKYAELVIDGGWGGDQRATVSDITVNDSVYQWNGGGSGDFAATCDLPDATIKILKGDPVVDGDINEQPVQGSLADNGNAFRVVDCKYQYILSIPSLDGKGTYQVQIWIDGVNVPTPGSPLGKVKFDIK